MIYKTIIIGAGISGLVMANELIRKGEDKDSILVIEKEEKPGGLIKTTIDNDFNCEWGPEGLRGSSENTQHLLKFSGIEWLSSTEQAKLRYVVKKGKLVALPTNPFKAIFGSIMSPLEKLRLLKEPLIPPNENDESVKVFFERRFGKGVLPLVDAFVSGIFGGNPSSLSTEYAFPTLKKAEKLKGSVIKGFFAMRKQSKRKKVEKKDKGKQPFLFTPKGGMKALLNQLAENTNVKYKTTVREIQRKGDRYIIQSDKEEWETERVVVATGIQGIGNIKILGELPNIKSPIATVSIVSLGYDMDSFPKPPKGYGFLIPDEENRFVLGILFTSNLFPQKAPEGKILLRCFVGGARHPDRAIMDEDALISKVQEEVKELIGATKTPIYTSVQRHIAKGIPQLNLGHEKNLEWKTETERQNPNLHFIGIGWTSISCDGLIGEAMELSRKLIQEKK